MAGPVIQLAKPEPAQPDPALVAVCEALLAEAKAGQLVALVGVAEYRDGRVDHVTSESDDPFGMAGHLLALAYGQTTEGEDE